MDIFLCGKSTSLRLLQIGAIFQKKNPGKKTFFPLKIQFDFLTGFSTQYLYIMHFC